MADIDSLESLSASDLEKRAETLSPSDLETMEKLTAEKNAELLQNKRLFEEKFPGSVEPTALQAAETEYAIKSYSFAFWAAGYVKVWCTVTYATGEVRGFVGSGGGAGAGAGSYYGGAPNTNFALSPKDIVGTKGQFHVGAATIGAYIHFWTPEISIGTLVGVGPGLAIGAFGGSGLWSVPVG